MIGNNPLYKQMLENNGIAPWKVTQEEVQNMMQAQQMQAQQPQKGDALSNQVNSTI